MKSNGHHLIADINVCSNDEVELLKDLGKIIKLLEKAAKEAGATCLKSDGHKFGEEEGVTAFIMLAESHISIHTWPENKFAALDIFMCGDSEEKINTAISVVMTAFPDSTLSSQIINRDYRGAQ